MYVDMHLHSCFSDGTCTPEELAEVLRQNDVGLAALTDHNTCAGFDRFAAACKPLGITPLRGIELDCLYDGQVIHLLGYGAQPMGRLMTIADLSRRLLLEMSRDLIKQMHRDYPQLDLAEYDRWDYDPRQGGWKGLHYLLQKGVTKTLPEGRHLYAQYGCDYSNYPFPSAAAVCQAVWDADGMTVLAHPGNWFAACTATELTAHFDALVALGVRGIECYYPAHTPQLTAQCLAYCGAHKLLVTAGSDCHGGFCDVWDGVHYQVGAVQVTPAQVSLGRLYKP
ncbi:MAG: PHP domain-containing protein [Angelakisella sp.]